jgi:transposase
MLALQLQRLQLIDQQMAELNRLIAQAMKSHQDAVIRLAEVPGLGVDSAQQIIAEVGAQVSTFQSAAELTSWVGTCPGKEESAEQNHSNRSAKGNRYLRHVGLTDQVLAMLRDQVVDIIVGSIFLFIGLAACFIASIRRRSGVRLFVWLGIWSAM